MGSDSEKIKALLDHLQIAVFVLDKSGKYLYVNKTYTNILQRSEESILGSTLSGYQSQGYLSHTTLDDVLQRKDIVHSVVTITDVEQNRIYNVLNTAVPYFDEAGEIQYIFYTQEPLDALSARIQSGIMNRKLINTSSSPWKARNVDIIAESPQMHTLLSMLDTVAKTDASILIYGPSGSGKEVVARYVHLNSPRKDEPFVVLNCAAIPESLMESELFGYEKGAFTGASNSGKIGLIEAASGGSLFLDEINSMPMSLQTKLLRVLESKQVTRVGSVRSKEINFRLICASNENLFSLIQEQRFRSDLFYRINVVSVNIPPLSQRKEDILPLTLYYLKHYCSKYSCVKVFSEQSLERLQAYSWPGNVRELRNLVERMVVTSVATSCEVMEVPMNLSAGVDDITAAPTHLSGSHQTQTALPDFSDSGFSLRSYMDQCELELLRSALEQLGSPAAVAKRLRIDLSNVYRKMQKYHLPPSRPEGKMTP